MSAEFDADTGAASPESLPLAGAGQSDRTQNVNIESFTPLTSPSDLQQQMPASSRAHQTVVEARETIRQIITRQDPRLLVVAGPCSIHDIEAAMDYARRLADLRRRLADRIYIIMRVYFEKPRTTIGWKGLINDPYLDGSFDLATGVRLARRLLIDINELGLPAGTEMLDPITPQYIDDLISWASIGARTTESQTHRQMASGLSMPVGFKNSTDGNLQTAIDAMKSAKSAHHFLGIDGQGQTCIVTTRGNPCGHVILRGGSGRPNYDPENVAEAARLMQHAELEPAIMIDCSHANSGKKHEQQEVVWNSVIEQKRKEQTGMDVIIGAMLESNIAAGRQDIPVDKSQLKYGVSVTDECIDWEKTVQLLTTGL